MAENPHFQQLTKAALGHMLSNRKIENAVVQLLTWKSVPSKNRERSQRYRLVLSDGIYMSQRCIVTGPICNKIPNEFDRYCLLKIPRYLMTEIQNLPVIVVYDLKLVTKGSDVNSRLGKPAEFGKDAPDLSSFPHYEPNYHLQRNDVAMELEHCSLDDINFELNDPVQPESTRRDQAAAPNWDPQPRTLNQEMAIPIYALTSYSHGNWIIKGRCTSKTNKREWKNAKGEGVLFSFDLKDSKDDIHITAFHEQCTAYFDKVNVGQVYLVSGGTVFEDSKKYCKTSSKYKINLTEKSVIEPCEDESNCPPITYQFRKIDQLRVGDYPDVIAIIKSIGDVESVKKQKTQEELLKRDLTILDDSNTEIVLTLWGNDTASNFVANEGDVLVASNLKVTDFNGLTLNSMMNSRIEINPQIDQASQLQDWYIRVKDSLQTKCLTEKSNPGNFRTHWRNLNEIHLGNVGEGMFTLQTKAVIFQMGKAIFFKGCKTCNKKLEDLENARYSCDMCRHVTTEFNYRLILPIGIRDHTREVWANAFHDSCMKLLGEETNLEELFHLYTDNNEEFEKRIRSFNLLSFIFRLRSKKEMYNDLPRIRTTITDLQPVNYIEYGNELLRKIREA